MGLDVTYKGSQIAQLTEDGNLTLETAGKYCEGDIELAYSGGDGDQNPVAPDNDVIFIDYDATIRYSYTAAEFLALTELPPNPTHSGLAAQGWNWDLTDAKAHVSKYGELIAVQLYYTSDGKTKVHFSIPQGVSLVYCGLNVNGEVEIDWGDGTEKSTVTGNSLTTNIYTPHTYNAGNYVMAVTVVSGQAQFTYADYWLSLILSERKSDSSHGKMIANITEIELGRNFLLNPLSYRGLRGLKKSPISPLLNTQKEGAGFWESYIYCFGNAENCPIQDANGMFNGTELLKFVCLRGVISLGNSMFKASYVYKVCLDGSITEIPQEMFSGVKMLSTIVIPETVTQIGASAFYNARSLGDICFKSQTPPVLATQYSLTLNAPSCTIHVPAGCLEAYKTATNYPTTAQYTYVEDE